MALGLATAVSAHPGVRARIRGAAARAALRIDFAAVDESLLAAAIFAETNARRTEHGAQPLRSHPMLAEMARRHADRMVEQDFYSHGDPDPALARPDDRARRAGIENPHIGENIHDHRAIQAEGAVYPLGRGRFAATPDGPPLPAYTYRALARAIVDEWMASSGHRENILRRDARQLGVGVRFYWRDGGWPFVKAVQDFQVFEEIEVD